MNYDKIIDISPLINSQLAVWPGDIGFSQNIQMNIQEGSHLHLSSIETTLHLGAHADSPLHYNPQGEDVSQRSLNYYIGPCQVIDVSGAKREIQLSDFKLEEVHVERVLFKTLSYKDLKVFKEDFVAFSPKTLEALAEKGVKLVGIDTPSVDVFDSKSLPSHQVLNKNNMANLEGLVLDHVPEGKYTLVALPLKIQGADASPVRAVLLSV